MVTGHDEDNILLSPTSISGEFHVSSGSADDGIQLIHLPKLASTVYLDGEGGTDLYEVTFAVQNHPSNYLVDIHDSGDLDDGEDRLILHGTSDADTFLSRERFVARLHLDAEGTPRSDVERINYDESINSGLIVQGYDGDDQFYSDDNSSITTFDGGSGNDFFQVGQVFGENPNNFDVSGVHEQDAISVSQITRGWLSKGNSFPLTIYGGAGDDIFSTYSNKAVLRLEGESGNDDFIIRAFVLADTNKLNEQDETIVQGGDGDDLIRYNINAPVSIDGGKGFDTVIVIGTELADAFVITDRGVLVPG